MPRAVLDPNVLVCALISPTGTSARLLLELRDGGFELLTSHQPLRELRDVLRRRSFRRYLTDEEADAYLELLSRESTVLEDPAPSGMSWSEDPGDEYLVALARSGRADALVSGDAHLLRLRARLPVMTAGEFLDRLVPPAS